MSAADNEIIYHIDYVYTENIFKQELDVIEKDLEVLEILKNHLVSADKYIMFCIHKDNKDFNKVKEWLENDI